MKDSEMEEFETYWKNIIKVNKKLLDGIEFDDSKLFKDAFAELYRNGRWGYL